MDDKQLKGVYMSNGKRFVTVNDDGKPDPNGSTNNWVLHPDDRPVHGKNAEKKP